MKRKINLFGLLVICSVMIMVYGCEIGESPIEIAKEHRDHIQNTPTQVAAPATPAVSNQPAVQEQPQPTEQVTPGESAATSESVAPAESVTPAEQAMPTEQAKTVKVEALPQEALKKVKAWAMVDEDKSQLHSKPDTKAEVVQELPFATVLLVLGKESTWLKVTLTDQKTWGWIPGEEVYESTINPEQFKLDDLANFYYAASTAMKDEAKRIRLLNFLIKQYPQSMIYFKDPDTQMVLQGDAKELALFSLADIYRADAEYQKAVDAYRTIIDEAKRTEVKGYAEWNLLKINKNDLKDTKKTIDEALHIINSYEKLGLSGYKWNIWVDLSASEVLYDTLISSGASGSDMVRYGQKVIATNNYPPVQIMGSIIEAEGYRKQNDTAAVENTIIAILKKYPSTPVQYYKKTVDYSTKALSFALRYYIAERHDYSAARVFSQEVAASTSNKTLINNAKFAIAYISDIWHFSRKDVIAAYQACGDVPDFLYGSAFPSAGERLKTIQGFVPFSGTVLAGGVDVRLEPNGSSAVVLNLAKGDKVTALYGNPPNFQGKWLKIKTQDNRFGWVRADALEKGGL